jgi:aminoglycoside phosphotransferase (APT) family kinase protein
VTDADISTPLLNLLLEKTAGATLAYAEPPKRMTGGFDASIFSFRLNNAPAPFDGPLVLRVLRPSTPKGRALREAAVQNALAQSGYPAPRVFAVEDDASRFGGPFLIMERMPGRALGWQFEGLGAQGAAGTLRMLRQFPHVRREIIRLWAEAQTRLQTLPFATVLEHMKAQGLDPDSLSFEASIKDMRGEIATLRLDHLNPVFDWLEQHKPAEVSPRVLCHGDSQPFNVLTEDGKLSGVIDLGRAVIADPAYDYGAALATFATVPVRNPRALRFLLRYFLRGLSLAHTAVIRTERSASDLAYYQIVNCATQLVAVSRKRAQGDTTTGAYNSPDGMATLVRHIAMLGGPQLHLQPVIPGERSVAK